jgi:hypothetical protein
MEALIFTETFLCTKFSQRYYPEDQQRRLDRFKNLRSSCRLRMPQSNVASGMFERRREEVLVAGECSELQNVELRGCCEKL